MFVGYLMAMMYEQLKGNALPSNFTVSDNLVGSYDLHGTGLDLLSASEGVNGDTIVDLGLGTMDTATITENITGGSTIHFSNPEIADIVGTPSIFGGEMFTQNGTEIATIDPSMLSDGMTITNNSADLITSSNDILGNTMFNVNSFASSPNFITDLSSTSSVATAMDSMDVLDGASSIADGLDFIDFL